MSTSASRRDLPLQSKLWESDDFSVYVASWAEAQRLPATAFASHSLALQTREVTPKIDAEFHYLFVWDRAAAQIVGIVHLGDVDVQKRAHAT